MNRTEQFTFHLHPKLTHWKEYCLFLSNLRCPQAKLKVQQSLYRSGQALRVPEAWGSQISGHSAHECGKIVSPTHRPPLSPGIIPGTHFWVNPRAIVWPKGLCQWKIPTTPLVFEPAAFRLVAQCLNQRATSKLYRNWLIICCVQCLFTVTEVTDTKVPAVSLRTCILSETKLTWYRKQLWYVSVIY